MAKTSYTFLLGLVETLMRSLMKNYEYDKIFGDVCMIEDYDKEYPGTMQEVTFELKLNTDKLFKKLIEETKRV